VRFKLETTFRTHRQVVHFRLESDWICKNNGFISSRKLHVLKFSIS